MNFGISPAIAWATLFASCCGSLLLVTNLAAATYGFSTATAPGKYPLAPFAIERQKRRAHVRAGINLCVNLKLTLPGAETNTGLHCAIAVFKRLRGLETRRFFRGGHRAD
jgi:hypothetical protein